MSVRLPAYVRNYAGFAAPILSFIAWAIWPMPWCIACESPNPWGHIDRTNGWIDVLSVAWFVLASFCAGLLRLPRSWAAPVGIVVAHLAAQPFGGVTWQSLRDNEGPVIVVVGLSVGLVSWLAGHFVALIVSAFPDRRA